MCRYSILGHLVLFIDFMALDNLRSSSNQYLQEGVTVYCLIHGALPCISDRPFEKLDRYTVTVTLPLHYLTAIHRYSR